MAGQRVSTGWKSLDSQLGGGLPKGSITAVSGATGSGKSIFALQFLINGIKSSGEPGLYIAIEESKNTVYRNMAGFGWDLRQYEDSNQLVIIDFPFHEVDQLLDMKNPIKELVDRFGVERAVIDSIMPVAAKFQSEGEMRKGFMRMIENIRAWDTTTMITTNDFKPATFQTMPQTEFGIERFTDGWIHMHYAQKAGKRKRALEIIKMKGSAHETEAVPFEIKKGGIDI
jgi:circadian clock protein KaiC